MEIEESALQEEEDITIVEIDDVVESSESDIPEMQAENERSDPKPTAYKGNVYDITSLIAVIIGLGVLLLCLSCNMGFYIMPFLAIILGIVGVVKANNSENPERTQLLSWLGIGGGTVMLLITVIGIALYILLIVLVLRTNNYSQF
jgi:hypothetical protein